jgi:predicted TPR repeat methyltransferase
VDVKETELVSTLYEHLGRSMLRLPEGTSEAIVDAFSNSLMYNPNNEVAKHLLSSQQQRGEEDNPPETFVRKLFDDYATNFEQSLKNLNYNAPGLLNQFLSQFRASWGTVLDLGCGSGLMGELLKSKANRLVGVDLSPNMLFVAEDKKIYDHLFVGDMIMLLDIVKENRNPRPSDVGRKMQGSNVMDVDRAYGYTWDRMHDNGLLVVAADVLVYLGNLEPLFKSVSQLLKPGDAFAFTVERLEHDGSAGWMLQRSGRFAHKREYIELLATRYNLKKHVAENIIPRMEQGKEIAGLLVIFQK